MPRRLGQHFLRDPRALAAIADALAADAGEPIVEIGGGHGELTAAIRERYPTSPLFVVEKDPRLAAHLRARFLHGVTVIEADIRRSLEDAVGQAGSGAASYVLAGNIPYYLTGHLLRLVGDLGRRPRRTVLLVQREVAERVAALPPRMNRLAAMVQFWAEAEIGVKVPRENFSPPPAVDSAVLMLQARHRQFPVPFERYEKVTRALFAQPRKTAANNLLSACGRGRSEIDEALRSAGASEGARPQDLPLEAIVHLAGTLS